VSPSRAAIDPLSAWIDDNVAQDNAGVTSMPAERDASAHLYT